MRGRGRLWTGLWPAFLAFAGLLIGHFISYLVVAPDARVREAVLEASGHRAHGLFVPLAGAALLAALIGAFVHQLRNHGTTERSGPRLLHLAGILWLLQTGGFVLLETTERVVASHAPLDLLHEPAFLVGLVVQAVIAVAGAVLMVLLSATVAVLRRYLARLTRKSSCVISPPERVVAAARSVARSAWNLRGPPIPPVA